MMAPKDQHVAVIGGSISGLFSAIVLVRLGYNVTVLERTREEALVDQGAGLGVSPVVPALVEAIRKTGISGSPLLDFMAKYDRTKTEYHFKVDGFQYLRKDGSIYKTIHSLVDGCTRWDLLYNMLRANFDGGYRNAFVQAAAAEETDGRANYLAGVTVTGIEDARNNLVKVEYRNGDGSTNSMEVNLVVGADGPSSFVRGQFLPEIERTYAGYACWRGLVKVDLLSEETRAKLGQRCTFYFSEGLQILTYQVPGLEGSLVEQERFCNLVWYTNCDGEELKNILTDELGIPHSHSLGIGKVRQEVKMMQRQEAAAKLPAPIAEVFQKIEAPFIQTITDNLAVRNVFLNGKVLLVGDAVAGLRPHVTSGTAQAAMHALLLSRVFEENPTMTLEEWSEETIAWSTFAHKVGVEAGNLSQFGDHPEASHEETAK